jgi:hypothetical protein
METRHGTIVLPDGRHILIDGTIVDPRNIIETPINELAPVALPVVVPALIPAQKTHKWFDGFSLEDFMARRRAKKTAGARAAAAVAANPQMSNRALAEMVGVTEGTIRRARKNSGAAVYASNPVRNMPEIIKTAKEDKVVSAPIFPAKKSAHPARKILAATLFLSACGSSATALGSNITWTAGMGETALGAGLLAGLGLAIDILQTVMPTVANELARRRHILSAVASWAIWGACALWTMTAVLSFSGSQIGDGIATREKIADQSTATKLHLAQARAARASITELRTPAQIGVEMQTYWAAIPKSVRKATNDCQAVTLPASLELCAPILKLKMAEDAARQRDELDRQIRADEATLAAVPAIGNADAGASNAAAFLQQFFSVSPGTVQRLRVGLLSILPIFSGLLFLFSNMLWREKPR